MDPNPWYTLRTRLIEELSEAQPLGDYMYDHEAAGIIDAIAPTIRDHITIPGTTMTLTDALLAFAMRKLLTNPASYVDVFVGHLDETDSGIILDGGTGLTADEARACHEVRSTITSD